MTRQVLSAVLMIAALVFGAPSYAQTGDAPPVKTILVLDSSGSMWGQIEGEAKIAIARKVIGDLLDTLPETFELGLMAYGHREKGNCDDIETLVAPGPGTADAIRTAIQNINPVGMTPLSKAVMLAAEELKYEENKATVILVSDGIETCDYDPCEVGTQLESLGIDFTAHVIGFDVAEQEVRAQLQCLAENTGGTFLTADNADELTDALEEVSAPPSEPAVDKLDTVFTATDGQDGPEIKSDLVWTITDMASGEVVVDNLDIGVLRTPLPAGSYLVKVERTTDQAVTELNVEVAAGASNEFVLPITTVALATVSASSEVPLGATIPVEWTGPDAEGDYITIVKVGTPDNEYGNYAYTADGNPVQLLMPAEAGDYEIRYVVGQDSKILARRPITVVVVEVSVSASSEAPLGTTIPVEWTGPNEEGDYITIVKVGTPENEYGNYAYTADGNPVQLLMPPEPGDYEIRYILGQDSKILARRLITVTAVEASVSASSEAPPGATIPVEWTGPNEDGDYITIVKVGADANEYGNYAYTRDGSPAQLLMPAEPGDYEIRYVLSQGSKVLASMPITVR